MPAIVGLVTARKNDNIDRREMTRNIVRDIIRNMGYYYCYEDCDWEPRELTQACYDGCVAKGC